MADRYLFFPSVAFCLIPGWLMRWMTEQYGKRGPIGAIGLTVLLAGVWTSKTLGYLGEWRDPRSVWYAAANKSSDVVVLQSLASHYQDLADQIPTLAAGSEAQRARAKALARVEWNDDDRLAPLLEEWAAGQTNGPTTRAFQQNLRENAMKHFEQALAAKGTRVKPNLFFRLGKLYMDNGDYAQARAEFERAYREARGHSFDTVQQELTVRSYHAIALTYWRERDYGEAMTWLERAQAEQSRLGGRWIADLPQQRAKLEAILARSKSK